MRDRRLWALLLVLLAGGAALWVWQGSKATQANSEALVLMSSIDLFWGEAEFNALAKGEAEPDPLYKRLAETHKLIAADNVAQLQASKGKVALLIQPRAFAPDELVRLDQWVRAGGRLLFFSDPALQWPSDLPIGDPARPLFTSMHSPLFNHWGVELVLPIDAEAGSAEATMDVGRYAVRTLSAGQWQPLASENGSDAHCRIAKEALVAECRPGKGQVILVADADLLHSAMWQSALPGTDSSSNIDWVEQLVSRLARGHRLVGQRGEIVE
ncbi:MAG: hypothetical protein IPM41_09410 [Sphingomonadales bacterium]|nr:hypothetical protein [Sphingomonadales bacterium]MBP6433751.1 hypothetical protein [Sphingorhabdus sp.]